MDWGQEEKGTTEDGWMASRTRWTRVWVNSGIWWWTGRPGVLRFMGSQRVGHDWATELNWTESFKISKIVPTSWLLPSWITNAPGHLQPLSLDFISLLDHSLAILDCLFNYMWNLVWIILKYVLCHDEKCKNDLHSPHKMLLETSPLWILLSLTSVLNLLKWCLLSGTQGAQ